MIVGRDFLNRAGINLDFQHGFMEWLNQQVAMKATVDGFQTVDEQSFFLDEAAEEEEAFVVKIKDAKYEAIKLEEVAQAQTHLTSMQR
eukprot:14229401-Ditylum_brightwellii.AAC.1